MRRRRRRLLEHPIDAISHVNSADGRLEVNVGRSRVECFDEQEIHELHDGRFVRHHDEIVDWSGVVDDRYIRRRDGVDHSLSRALASVCSVDCRSQFAFGPLFDLDVGVEQDPQIVEHLVIDRLAPGRQPQQAIAMLERKHTGVLEIGRGELIGQRCNVR